MTQSAKQLHKPLTVACRLHPDQSAPWQLPIKSLSLSRCVLQLLLVRLPGLRVHPTNLLPTGVVINSNNIHRRLLPTDRFGPPTRSILGYRTEPSLLSNQPSGWEGGSWVLLPLLHSGTMTISIPTSPGFPIPQNDQTAQWPILRMFHQSTAGGAPLKR